MRYRIEISQKARDQLRALPKDLRRNIGQRMEAMCDDLHGDMMSGGKIRPQVKAAPMGAKPAAAPAKV